MTLKKIWRKNFVCWILTRAFKSFKNVYFDWFLSSNLTHLSAVSKLSIFLVNWGRQWVSCRRYYDMHAYNQESWKYFKTRSKLSKKQTSVSFTALFEQKSSVEAMALSTLDNWLVHDYYNSQMRRVAKIWLVILSWNKLLGCLC